MGSRTIITIAFAVALLPACKDDAKPPYIDATISTDDSGPTCSGTIAFTEMCATSDECESCLCKLFGHEMHCSKTCGGPTDCPAPSTGCANGFCKP